MSINWTMLVPSIVFTQIKTKFSNEIKQKYNMTASNFSTEDSQNKKAVFPFVYVSMLAPAEMGNDIESETVNAGLFTFQIDVTDNQSQARAREVAGEILRVMKTMRFNAVAMPYFDNSTVGTYRIVSRYRRIIGAGDTI